VGAAPLAFPEAVRSKAESHISGVTGVHAKFVQHHLLGLAPSFAVTLVHSPEIFPLRLVPQSALLQSPLSRVTSYVSRRAPLGLHLAWLDAAACRKV